MERTLIHKPIGMSSRFDWVMSGAACGPLPVFDEPLMQDNDSVVLPSLGSLVPGWTLLVPRQLVPNLKSLDASARERLFELRSAAAAVLNANWSEALFEFEHGPHAYGSITGCGVDQAHLHLVPLPFDLVEAAASLPHKGFLFCSSLKDPWSKIEDDGDYLVVRNVGTGAGIVLRPRLPESQALRKLVAKRLGRVNDWNYRVHSGADHALATRNAFRGASNGG